MAGGEGGVVHSSYLSLNKILFCSFFYSTKSKTEAKEILKTIEAQKGKANVVYLLRTRYYLVFFSFFVLFDLVK